MKEVWKHLDIKPFTHYQVSNLGKVRNGNTEKLISMHINHNGYYRVKLYDKEYKNNFRVNRLVALTFIDNPSMLEEVHHIDENKLNNKENNLCWSTKKENISDYWNKRRQ